MPELFDVGVDFKSRVPVRVDLTDGLDVAVAVLDDLVDRHAGERVLRGIRARVVRIRDRVRRTGQEGQVDVRSRRVAHVELAPVRLLTADEDLVLDAEEVGLEDQVDEGRLRLAIVAGRAAGTNVVVDAVGVGRGDRTVTHAVVVGDVAHPGATAAQPFKRREVHRDRRGLDFVVVPLTAGRAVEVLVIHEVAALVGVVTTALDARVGRQVQVAGRNALVVDVRGVRNRRGRRGLHDVATERVVRVHEVVVTNAGRDRVGERGGRGTIGAVRRRVLPAREVAVDPPIVIVHEALMQVLEVEVHLHLAALKRDDRQRRGDVEVLLVLVGILARGVFPGADHAEGDLLGEDYVVVELHLVAAVVVDLVRERRRDLGEGRALGDVVDNATGIALAEEDRGGTLDDFNAVDVVQVVRDVPEDTVAHQVVHLETTHREAALRGRFVGRHAHRKPVVTRGGRGVTEQVGDRAGVGVIEELA